ncbi:hypothetical protein ScalyP_jg5999 [Parmales sp. scaly parma]|nr:hypothetical protein ScalyP_jg5999 [Parmales sp. scaly parma]
MHEMFQPYSTGPEYGPSGTLVPGSVKDTSAEYYSQVDGSLVKFGKDQSLQPAHENRQWDFLRHRDGPQHQMPQETIIRGVDTTKFKKGFQRRQYENIRQDEQRFQAETWKAENAVSHGNRRRQRLDDIDKRNGMALIMSNAFNPINGGSHIEPTKKRISMGEGPSEELQRIGHIQLRDSLSRFYLPHYSGTNHDKRQQTLVTEGLIKSKSSSILGVGSSDLGSYGVEDQFSKAQYEPNRQCLGEGLVESTAAGRYTPDKTGVWNHAKEKGLMSKLSISRSTGSIHPSKMKMMRQSQANASNISTLQASANRSFVAPSSSRGREMDRSRDMVIQLE